MTRSGNPFEGIAIRPPDIAPKIVAREVQAQFGLTGELAPLVSERDQNFLLQTASGRRYVIKVTGAAEPPVVSRFHVAVLRHLQDAASVLTPNVVNTRCGKAMGCINDQGQSYRLRIVSYIDGQLMSSARLTPQVARSFGARLAALDIALAGISHEGDRPALLWDLQRVDQLREVQDHIDDPDVAARVRQVIVDYERHVEPRLGALRRQVIHGDANPENVLLDTSGMVAGFIDFSDSVNAPLIVDAAVACSYLRTGEAHALELILPFISAYDAALPLESEEVRLLFDLVRARLATTITIMYWRLALRSASDPYREKTLRREQSAIAFLSALEELGRNDFTDRIKRALSAH